MKDRFAIQRHHWELLLSTAALLALMVGLASKSAFGQMTDEEARMRGRPTVSQNGQLFVVRFTPKDKRFDVFAAGEPVASLDPSRVKVFGRVFPAKGAPRELKIVWLSGQFRITGPLESSRPVDLEITDRKTSGAETFHFNQPRVPTRP